ncbi:MAG: ABC transporter substrate-binding protein [Streptomycetaceae bacterium]|nr:ABC transporter substrate-binding protein [Streptomycetaceae bacterium]
MTALSARRRTLAAGAVLVAGALLLTGCGDDGGGSKATKWTTADPALTAKLPKQYQDSKVLNIGSEVAYPPVEFKDKDGKTFIGFDIDMANAIGQKLGVKVKIQDMQFGQLITSIDTKRIDLIMSAMSDTKDRQTGMDEGNKVGEGIDFVDYFNAGGSILVQKGNPQNIKTLDDLCGKVVALQKATTHEETANKQSQKCTSEGKPAITIQTYEHDNEALLRIKQGAAVADISDFPVAAYAVQTSPNDFQLTGDQIEPGPYGIGVGKFNAQLRDAVKEAVQALIADGTYAKIMQKWNVQQGSVTQATLNGGS